MLSIELTYCQPLRVGMLVAWTTQVFPGLLVCAELNNGTQQHWEFTSFPFGSSQKQAWIKIRETGEKRFIRLKNYGVRRPYRARARRPPKGMLICEGAEFHLNHGVWIRIRYHTWGYRGFVEMRSRWWQTVNLDTRCREYLEKAVRHDLTLRYPFLRIPSGEPITFTHIEY